MDIEQKLLEFLTNNHTGIDNAVHSKALEKRFDISSRTIRRYINNMRKSGIPVCSDATGYWIAANPKEANKTVKRLGDFVGEINNARTGLAVAAIQMRSVTKITEKNIQISVKVG